MARKVLFFKILKKFQFSNCLFFRLSNTYQFYACFLLDITCTLVPANKLVSVWCNFDRVSISLSILHLSLDLRKNCKTSTKKTFKI